MMKSRVIAGMCMPMSSLRRKDLSTRERRSSGETSDISSASSTVKCPAKTVSLEREFLSTEESWSQDCWKRSDRPSVFFSSWSRL